MLRGRSEQIYSCTVSSRNLSTAHIRCRKNKHTHSAVSCWLQAPVWSSWSQHSWWNRYADSAGRRCCFDSLFILGQRSLDHTMSTEMVSDWFYCLWLHFILLNRIECSLDGFTFIWFWSVMQCQQRTMRQSSWYTEEVYQLMDDGERYSQTLAGIIAEQPDEHLLQNDF